MDDTAYKPPRRRNYRAANTPWGGTILGTKGERGIGTRSHLGDVPLTPEGEAFRAKLERETTISLREHPERWQVKRVTDTKQYQLTPYGERLRAGRG